LPKEKKMTALFCNEFFHPYVIILSLYFEIDFKDHCMFDHLKNMNFIMLNLAYISNLNHYFS